MLPRVFPRVNGASVNQKKVKQQQPDELREIQCNLII